MVYDLIVVGGGPAGMLGAAAAGARGLKVILLEKNGRLGKKLAITGSGRCNVTNYGDLDDFQNNIVSNGKFLYSSLKAFDNHGLIALLHSLGVKTRVEQDNRVFPVSDKSGDVIRALQKNLQANNVEIRLNSAVEEVLVRDGRAAGVRLADGSRVAGKNVLIATGGMSYRQTGSSGDGYKMAQQLGHSIVNPRPALVPLETRENWVKDLQGVALENVRVQALVGDRVKAEQTGELLFTHFGVSGPAILKISSYINKHEGLPVKLKIDLDPGLSKEQLEARLLRDFKKNQGRYLKNALGGLLPQRLIPVILALAGVDGHKQVDQVTREERERVAHVLKNIILTVKRTRPLNEAIVTGGGVDTREINPSTMESKIVKGLYFAGEVIDVDALTGGYNLQIAFSTGYLAGISVDRDY